jgi:hypothetical protein
MRISPRDFPCFFPWVARVSTRILSREITRILSREITRILSREITRTFPRASSRGFGVTGIPKQVWDYITTNLYK